MKTMLKITKVIASASVIITGGIITGITASIIERVFDNTIARR